MGQTALNTGLNAAALRAMDDADPLAPIRERFLVPDGVVYMNGNSLGPLCRDVRERMHTAVSEEWGHELIRGWNSAGWYDLACRLGDKIGRLVGAQPGQVVVADSTSVNLFKAVAAALALRPERHKIVSEAGNFPTDLYMLDGLTRFSKNKHAVDVRAREEVVNGIDEDTAVVVLTHVHYVTGEIFPMAEISRRAHEFGALIVWDLSHSVGAVSTELDTDGADFAVGCGYKHLNGGPGAPAFIYAATRHHAAMRQPLSGWFGHANPFTFSDDFDPADGIRRMLCGTTPVLGASALEASVDVMLEIDASAAQAKGKQLSRVFQELVQEHCAGLGFELLSPHDPEGRGAHISYAHEQGYGIMQNLIANGVIGDFRAPDGMRFGFSPLFMRFTDLLVAAQQMRDIVESQSYLNPEFQKQNSVT